MKGRGGLINEEEIKVESNDRNTTFSFTRSNSSIKCG